MLVTVVAALASQTAPQAPDASALAYFQGDWRCAGYFTPSNRPLSSQMGFSLDTISGALLKQHRDVPPATYQAHETWAAGRGGGFRMTIADRFSGLRWYSSEGWRDDRWTWERQRVGAEPREQFIYIRQGPAKMVVEWWVVRGDAPLAMGDTLTCDRDG